MTRVHARGPVLAGLGITDMTTRIYGRSSSQFAADAIRLAVADAGLALGDIDGLLVNPGISGLRLGDKMGLGLAAELQLHNLSLLSEIQGYGSSAGAMVQYAAMAVSSGMVDHVVCVFGDAPLSPKVGAGAGPYGGGGRVATGFSGLRAASGITSTVTSYALAASRHMARYGTTSEQFGAVAVAARAWAAMNPLAQLRTPISLDDHQNSRLISDPLRLLDCCLVSNGAVALVVTTAERGATLRQPPVHVLGWGQTHPGYAWRTGSEFGLVSGATRSGATALRMAGLSIQDIDIAEIYDCFTYTTIITLEDYGFCAKGEGGAFVASGAIAPGGSCPTNTGGGQLSSYYMWGMTPLSEAIIQARGQAGERQVARHDTVLVSGNGGTLEHHATLILSPHAHS